MALGVYNSSPSVLSNAPHETHIFPNVHVAAFNSVSLLRAISGTASPTNAFGAPPKIIENQYSAPPALQFIDGSGDGQHNEQNQSMNTTPLMQSRRSKSPLVCLLLTRA